MTDVYPISMTEDETYMTDFSKFANPGATGCGTWWVMFILAKEANTKNKRRFVANFMIPTICKTHKCSECNGHCTEYVKNNPPMNAIRTNISLLDWTINFYNDVSRRIGKPLMRRRDFIRFVDGEDCENGCGNDKKMGFNKQTKSARTRIKRKKKTPTLRARRYN